MKNHVVLIIVLFLLVLVTANCTSSNNSELLYIDEKGIIHIEIEKILDNKVKYVSKENNDMAVPITQNEKNDKIYKAQVIYPIISDGDAIGSVILLSKDEKTKMSEVEQKVAQSAANFLGKQMEI